MGSGRVGISDDNEDRLAINTDGSINVAVTGGSGGTVNQGTPAAAASGWPVKLTDGTDSADITAASALKVDGSAVTQPVSDAGGSLTVDGTVTANAGTGPFPVSDNGGSLTVDGTVTTNPGATPDADILGGFVSLVDSAGPSTLITIPAGREWVGTVQLTCADTTVNASPTLKTAAIEVNGTGAMPASGTMALRIQTAGSYTAVGAVPCYTEAAEVRAKAPAGNSITLRLSNSSATTFTSRAHATGKLI